MKITTANSSYKKLAVQWLNEALCFVSSFVVVESLVLRNCQLLVAANRYKPFPLLDRASCKRWQTSDKNRKFKQKF